MYLDVLQTNETKGFCLFCEHISYNERLQGVIDQLTDFQKQNTKVILQMGMNTTLPAFEGYVEPPPPPPPPLVLQTSQQTESEELNSLPSDYSDAGSYVSLSMSTSNESAGGMIILSSSEDAPEAEEPINIFDEFEGADLMFGDNNNNDNNDNTIDNSEILSIYLLVPQGGPRYEIVSSIGTISTTKKQRWLFKNGASDKDLYHLVISADCTKFSYYMDTVILRQMLINQIQLVSRRSLFDLLEQRKYDHYTVMYIWHDRDVLNMDKRIKQSTSLEKKFFPSLGNKPLSDYTAQLGIQWSQKPISSVQPLDKDLFVHLDQKRFLSDPLGDFYYSPGSDKYSSGQFDVSFRGFCLAHPSGTGKRRRIVEQITKDRPLNSKKQILLLCNKTAEEHWLKEFAIQNCTLEEAGVRLCHWETLHQQTSRTCIESGESYYEYFRYIVSEASFRTTPLGPVDIPLMLYVELLGKKWDLIVLDDVMHGIMGNRANRSEYWTVDHSPLYSYVQNLISPSIICTSSDYPTDELNKIRLIGGLLQRPGSLPISCFKETSAPLYSYIMNHLIYKCPRQHFQKLLCTINTNLQTLKMDFYENMAQIDYLNRYSSSPFDKDYGHVPSAKLAHILTCPPIENLYEHQAYYSSQPIHSLDTARQQLNLVWMASTSHNAYHLPLMDRQGVLHATHATHATPPAGPSSNGNHNYLQALVSDKNALVDQFSCTLCLESHPSYDNDYIVTPCGHFMCWSCLSPWMHHMTTRNGDIVPELWTPCLACKTPISRETIIRYRNCTDATTPSTAIGPLSKRRKIEELLPLKKQPRGRKDTNKNKKELKSIIVEEPMYQGMYGSKLQMLIPWLREQCDQNQKVVLFTHHKTYTIDLCNILRNEKLPIARYMGAQKDKQRIVRMFAKKYTNNRPNGRILLLSSGIGYDDMDLSECTDHVVFLDNCYNSPSEQESVENAVIGRIQRRNRTRPLEVMRLLVEGSSEETQYKAYLKHLEASSSIKT